MLELCLLGCGGMMPLPYRKLTSLMARYNGNSFNRLWRGNTGGDQGKRLEF